MMVNQDRPVKVTRSLVVWPINQQVIGHISDFQEFYICVIMGKCSYTYVCTCLSGTFEKTNHEFMCSQEPRMQLLMY